MEYSPGLGQPCIHTLCCGCQPMRNWTIRERLGRITHCQVGAHWLQAMTQFYSEDAALSVIISALGPLPTVSAV